MLLRAGRDIWFLLDTVRSSRYLLMFVLLMLWARVVLIVVENVMSTTQLSIEEDGAMPDSLINPPVDNAASARSMAHTSAVTEAR